VYLVYLVVAEGEQIQTISLVMIIAIYAIQALVFILRRKWDMIGWMFFYILAIPVFSFALPLYSFWKMDDFSWGQTRVVLGESGKKMIVHVRTRSPFTILTNCTLSGRRQVRSPRHSPQILERLRALLGLLFSAHHLPSR
jgi:chitin synthase